MGKHIVILGSARFQVSPHDIKSINCLSSVTYFSSLKVVESHLMDDDRLTEALNNEVSFDEITDINVSLLLTVVLFHFHNR